MDSGAQLQLVIDAQLEAFPEHRQFLARRLASATDRERVFLELLADKVLKIADGDLVEFCKGYRWLCGAVFDEELHFRRTGEYRLSKFEDAVREVYSDKELMRNYMRGLLLTQLWWPNHTAALQVYVDEFLANNAPNYSHLEVGPGHGLLLNFALSDPRSGSVHAIDISQASLEETRHAVELLGSAKSPELIERDLFSSNNMSAKYDSIVIAEVLEHLETPVAALESLLSSAAPGARLFVHMPVNSPAPDHIYLARNISDVVDIVRSAGWSVVNEFAFPSAGLTLEQAIDREGAISVVVIGAATSKAAH